MKKYYLIISLFTLLLTVVSCEDIIEFKGEETASRLVVNAVAIPDTFLYVQVTKSVFFLNKGTDLFKDKFGNSLAINDAQVELFVNGASKGVLAPVDSEHGLYQSEYRMRGGDSVRVVVNATSFPIGQGVTNLPLPVTFDVDTLQEMAETYQFDSSTGRIETIKVKRTHYNIHFTDPASVKNQYGLSLQTEQYGWQYDMELFSIDPLLSANGQPKSSFLFLFNDNAMNGTEYTLNVYTDEPMFDYPLGAEPGLPPAPLNLTLYSFSNEYFLYCKSMKLIKNEDGLMDTSMFTEPTQMYSNVKNGIGIVAGYSKKTISVQ